MRRMFNLINISFNLMNTFILILILLNIITMPFSASAGTIGALFSPYDTGTIDPALSNYELINEPGFDDILNRYAWSMIVFKDELYVGTWNTQGFFVYNPSNSAQVFRYSGGTEWEKVVDAGLNNADNMGVRTMIVWDDPDDSPDKGEAIYCTTMNKKDGLEVWRTFDGDDWEVVVGAGSPYPNGFEAGPENDSGRGMAIFNSQGKQWIYLGTRGNNGGEIWRTQDGVIWEKVTDALSLGLTGRPIAMATMCVFQDDPDMPPALFVGTWGTFGFYVIKSYDGVNFETVATRGINKATNQGVGKLIVFDDTLWLLGMNYVSGFDIFTASPGVIDGNEDWELVATKGLTDKRNSYAWNAIVYDNGTEERLYIGTFNRKKGFLLYSMTSNLEYAVEVGPGATHPSGMGDLRNWGARSFAVYEGKLVIGLACYYLPTKIWTAW